MTDILGWQSSKNHTKVGSVRHYFYDLADLCKYNWRRWCVAKRVRYFVLGFLCFIIAQPLLRFPLLEKLNQSPDLHLPTPRTRYW